MALEIEVKLALKDTDHLEFVRKRLIALGAQFECKEKEHDEYFDFEDRRIAEANNLLRIRNQKILCFKSNHHVEDGLKVENEDEMHIADYPTFLKILNGLGLFLARIKEKIRETYLLEHTKITLDTLPFGLFIEIEGDRENIVRIASQLGFQSDQFIAKTYTKLYKEHCTQRNIPLQKFLVFEHENDN